MSDCSVTEVRKGKGFWHRGLLILALLFFSLGYAVTVLRGEPEMGSVGGKIYGVTCHGDLIALAGANVSAVDTETGLTMTTTTDPDGSYNLTVASGAYRLYLLAPFYEAQVSYSFGIRPGSVISGLNFYLNPAIPPYCPAVMFQGWLYRVTVFSNASATDLVFDSSRRLLNFTIGGMNGAIGRFLVIVPKILLDGTPVVFVDNVEVTSTLIEGAAYYFVRFEYSLGSHAVTVGGSRTIPEFPRGYLLIIFAAFVFLAGILSALKVRLNDDSQNIAVNHAGK